MTAVAALPGALQTSPSVIPLLSSEEYVIGNDVTAQLAQGDTISSPVVTLYDLNANTVVSGLPAPTVVGNVIQQTLDATALALVSNHSYRMTWTFNASTGKRPSSQTILQLFPAP